jgi:hypothetical protein
MQYIGKSPFNKILSYFHGNIHVTLSYGFLNWFVSHMNLYKENSLIIMEPFPMKRHKH